MKLVLFVCRGNTCRSPMAEVTARAMAGDALRFASAGVAVDHVGGPADPRAIACVATAGLDLTAHKTRAVSDGLLAAADEIFALDRSVLDALLKRTPEIAPARIRLLAPLLIGEGLQDIDDPWCGTAADYARALDQIERAVAVLVCDLR